MNRHRAMSFVLVVAAVAAILFVLRGALLGSVVEPAVAAARVAAGRAVLIDVREPDEWETGVVRGALLLPLSDLRGERALWKVAIAQHRDKEFILYCRSGNRSGVAARLLAAEGLRSANAGGFSAWRSAGQPVEKPAR